MSFYGATRGCFRALARPMFRFRVAGASHVPEHGAAVVIAPHRSWLDPFCVGAACPRPVRFIMIDRFYDKPWLTWFFRGMRAIPVTPGGTESIGALRAGLRALRAGEVVGIFPEGRVVAEADRDRVPVHPGAALLAIRTGAPVVPMAIEGSASAWPHGRLWPGPHPVRVGVGEPILPPAAQDRASVDAFTGLIAERLRLLADTERAA